MNYRVFDFSVIDKAFADMEEWASLFDLKFPVSTLSPTLLSNHYPPCDYYAEEVGTLHFEFAVAGYQDEEIDLKFEDNYLILTLKPKYKKNGEATPNTKYFQKAIKKTDSITKALVPFTKYDISKVVASLKDGLLSIVIPVKDEAKPVNVKIDIQ